MSAKNQLQEYFQKQQLSLPIYEVLRIGGSDHQPLWQASVRYDNDKHITGEIFSNKGQAMMDVAERALKSLQTLDPIKIYSPSLTALFVDVENMPNFIDEVQKKFHNMIIYAFIGHHHCLATKIWSGSNITKILVHSTRTDGTDTAMQVYIGYHLAQKNYDRYYIATRDHYGSALVEMITCQPGPWEQKIGYVVTQVSHILETM
jgi:hypothetical protein